VRHDGVAERQQKEEFLANGIVVTQVYQRLVAEFKGLLVNRIERKIYRLGFLERGKRVKCIMNGQNLSGCTDDTSSSVWSVFVGCVLDES
jgi:hypothetical protein